MEYTYNRRTGSQLLCVSSINVEFRTEHDSLESEARLLAPKDVIYTFYIFLVYFCVLSRSICKSRALAQVCRKFACVQKVLLLPKIA